MEKGCVKNGATPGVDKKQGGRAYGRVSDGLEYK